MTARVKRDPVILGPVPCQGCRRLVAWVRGGWHDWIAGTTILWYQHRYRRGRHDCPALPAGLRMHLSA